MKPSGPARPHLPLLTSLRFFAAVEVLVFHVGSNFLKGGGTALGR